MRDELPGLQAELEAQRRLLAPMEGRLESGRLIESLLDLHHGEQLVILGPRQRKTAGANLQERQGHIDLMSPVLHL
jgi:hypothetical protein